MDQTKVQALGFYRYKCIVPPEEGSEEEVTDPETTDPIIIDETDPIITPEDETEVPESEKDQVI
jgi:hypothetical protein